MTVDEAPGHPAAAGRGGPRPWPPRPAAAKTAATTGASGGGGRQQRPVTLGFIPSWTDGLSTAYLWKDLLEESGYTVEIAEITDAAPLYTGLAEGDIDVYPSAWPRSPTPTTWTSTATT